MKNALTKLKLVLIDFGLKKNPNDDKNLYAKANIEQKWWMGEYMFADQTQNLKKPKFLQQKMS